MVIETETFRNKVTTEQVDGVSIGRMILPVVGVPTRWEPNSTFLRFFNALNCTPNDLRKSLLFGLNHNTPSTPYSALVYERPVSAYFTYNPKNETVIVEWGTISLSSGEAKLHTYLNRMIDYQDRVKQGMKLSSGHMAKVDGEETYIALLDNLRSDIPIHRNDPMGKLINTLHFSGFIPITSDGFVQIPIFGERKI